MTARRHIMTHWACLGWRQVWIVLQMKNASRSKRINDWVIRQLRNSAAQSATRALERRDGAGRRRRAWWSALYGSFNPRRRQPTRRLDDTRFHPVDWYSANLLAMSIGILLLSAADAFLTSILLVHGA